MKKKIFALCAIMLLASGCGKVPKLENGKEAIVTFKDGEKISVDDFYELIKNEYGLNSLISMVDKYICETEFEDYKDTASKNADALINSLKEQYGSEDKLLEALQGSGYNTIDAYKDYAYLSYLQSHAIEEYAKTKITDKEIENYYKNDAIGDMEIIHILITINVKKDSNDYEKKAVQDEAKKKANEVIDKLNTAKKNGEDITEAFTKLAKEYSEDDSNKDKGGALGKINYGSLSSKYDELVKAAKSLKDGEYSTSVITTELGYHVILKVKTYEKDTLENLKDSIKETLAEKYITNNKSSIGLNALQHYRKEYKMEIQDDEMKKQYSNYIQNALLTIQQNNSSKYLHAKSTIKCFFLIFNKDNLHMCLIDILYNINNYNPL